MRGKRRKFSEQQRASAVRRDVIGLAGVMGVLEVLSQEVIDRVLAHANPAAACGVMATESKSETRRAAYLELAQIIDNCIYPPTTRWKEGCWAWAIQKMANGARLRNSSWEPAAWIAFSDDGYSIVDQNGNLHRTSANNTSGQWSIGALVV